MREIVDHLLAGLLFGIFVVSLMGPPAFLLAWLITE
jgi:hypothetical protein